MSIISSSKRLRQEDYYKFENSEIGLGIHNKTLIETERQRKSRLAADIAQLV